MSYDLIVEGAEVPASLEPWVAGLRDLGLEVAFTPSPPASGWLPARLEVPDGSPLIEGLSRAAASMEDLTAVVEQLEAIRGLGTVHSGFMFSAGGGALTFSFGARDPASVPLLAFCTSLVAAAQARGAVLDPQTGLTFAPSDPIAAFEALVEEEFDLFLADAPEAPFDGWK